MAKQDESIKTYKSNMQHTMADLTALVGLYNDALDFIVERGLSDDFMLFHLNPNIYRTKKELEKSKVYAETAENSKPE